MQDQIRLLFADDHIPDKEVSNLNTCAEIREVLKKRKRGNINAWTDAYYNASEVIRALESPKYHLITAREHGEAKDLIEKDIDVGIIDIGWYNDDTLSHLSKDERGEFGWKIAKSANENTLLIAYSSRFRVKEQLAIDAANMGMIPFFKMDTSAKAEENVRENESDEIFESRCKAAAKALRATVDFLVSMPQRMNPINITLRTYNQALSNYKEGSHSARQWTKATLFLTVTSVVLILIGIITAYTGKVEIGVISSASSIIVGAVSSLLFRQSKQQEKQAENAWKQFTIMQDKIIEELK